MWWIKPFLIFGWSSIIASVFVSIVFIIDQWSDS